MEAEHGGSGAIEAGGVRIGPPREEERAALVRLMVDYCRFYGTAPGPEALDRLVLHLKDEPGDGLQLVARDEAGALVGFATIYWSWSTTRARRIAIMNDLYVAPGQRGAGVGRALIEACAAEARAAGIESLEWRTRPDNHRAQALYDGIGARRDQWLDYSLASDAASLRRPGRGGPP